MKRRRCFSIVPLFADNAVCFPSRTCARPRNKYYCACFPPSAYAEKMPRNISVFPVSYEKTGKRSKSRVKVGVWCKILPAFERETR